MIFKVYYQVSKDRNPKREQTLAIYVEAEDVVEARALVEKNTPYNIEFIQELNENHLEYEKENVQDFHLTVFN